MTLVKMKTQQAQNGGVRCRGSGGLGGGGWWSIWAVSGGEMGGDMGGGMGVELLQKSKTALQDFSPCDMEEEFGKDWQEEAVMQNTPLGDTNKWSDDTLLQSFSAADRE